MDHHHAVLVPLTAEADAHVADDAVTARPAEEEQIARGIGRLHLQPGVELRVGVAGDGDAGQLVHELGEAGAVDAIDRRAAPEIGHADEAMGCLLYTSPSPRD